MNIAFMPTYCGKPYIPFIYSSTQVSAGSVLTLLCEAAVAVTNSKTIVLWPPILIIISMIIQEFRIIITCSWVVLTNITRTWAEVFICSTIIFLKQKHFEAFEIVCLVQNSLFYLTLTLRLKTNFFLSVCLCIILVSNLGDQSKCSWWHVQESSRIPKHSDLHKLREGVKNIHIYPP